MNKDIPTSPAANGPISPESGITSTDEAVGHFRAAARNLAARDWDAPGDGQDAAVRVLKSFVFVGARPATSPTGDQAQAELHAAAAAAYALAKIQEATTDATWSAAT